MHQNCYTNNLFAPENFKCVEINKDPPNVKCNNFMNGLLNAKHILYSLEKSLKKSQNYEDRMLQCRRNHSRKGNERHFGLSDKGSPEGECNTSRSSADSVESCSSNVCLKYQYRELCARYDTLLRAYDDCCKLETSHKEIICKLRKRMRRDHVQLIDANKALLAVGEKYMELRRKKLVEKRWYEVRVEQLKQRIEDVVKTAERARIELDDQLNIICPEDISLELLLEEVKKCNQLFLENIQRKSIINE